MKSLATLVLAMMAAIPLSAQEVVSTHITKPTDAYRLFMPNAGDYILKAKAATSDTLAEIESAFFRVNNSEKIYAAKFGEFWIANWEAGYGWRNIVFTAISNTGAKSSDSVFVEVNPLVNDMTVTALKDEQIKFGGAGRTVYDTVKLPGHLGAFDSLHATLNVVCPTGDCDPWDRVAWIDVKGPDGAWIELIRYITPYGVSCTHEIDLTDYLFLLESEVEFRIFIDTWAGSWEFTLDLEYFAGTPDNKYGMVTPIYDGVFQFGDYADLFPFDLVTFDFHPLTQEAKYNILLSGHGWNSLINTGNAAEFYPAVHQVFLDTDSFDQATLRNCNPNPDNCTGQQGTWQIDRSGWCPGAVTHPFVYDLASYIPRGDVDIYYEFDNGYVDFCHPNHPNCVDFVTCDDCNAGFNPHYYVGASVFTYNDTEPFEKSMTPVGISSAERDIDIRVHPNPASSSVRIDFGAVDNPTIRVFNNLGQMVQQVPSSLLESSSSYTMDVSGWAAGSYFVEVISRRSSAVEKVVVQ